MAVPAALLVLALGLLSPAEALDELAALGPTLAFLAAVLVLGELAERAGLFAALGDRIGRRARGRPVRCSPRLRGGRARHGAPVARRHGRAAHPGRLCDRSPLAAAGAAARLRLRAPRELGIAAAAGVEPLEPARLSRHGPLVRPLRRADGVPVARRAGRRVVRVPVALRERPRRPRPRTGGAAGTGATARGRRPRHDARRPRALVGGRPGSGRGGGGGRRRPGGGRARAARGRAGRRRARRWAGVPRLRRGARRRRARRGRARARGRGRDTRAGRRRPAGAARDRRARRRARQPGEQPPGDPPAGTGGGAGGTGRCSRP